MGQPASFELMAPTLSPTFWSMHGGAHPADNCSGGFAHVCTGGNVMAQRNYGCDDALSTYFPDDTLNLTLDDAGAAAFASQLYVCQLATALALKSSVESHRATNIYGLLTWQLGEVWGTYGWGSLEYSSGAGAVSGGRWKPSHYMLARAYADVFAACAASAQCYLKNDAALRALESADVTFAVTRLRDGSTAQLSVARNISLPRGANAVAWLCAGGGSAANGTGCPAWSALLPATGCDAAGADCVLDVRVTDSASGDTLASNVQLLTAPGNLNGASRAVAVAASVGDARADGSVPITVSVAGGGAAPALFVTLHTAANGRFDDNFLTLLPAGDTVINFLPFAPQQRDILAATLRVDALGALLNAPRPPRPSTGNCTTLQDTDVNDYGVYAAGATLADCCELCWADPTRQCLAAAFNPASPGCWLKYGLDTIAKVGIQTCVLNLPKSSATTR